MNTTGMHGGVPFHRRPRDDLYMSAIVEVLSCLNGFITKPKEVLVAGESWTLVGFFAELHGD
jgi:hypothetical protein